MKKLVIVLLLLQGCTAVSHHQREYRCSENCNETIKNLKNLEIDSRAFFSKLFIGEKEVEVCEDPIGTFSCAAQASQ